MAVTPLSLTVMPDTFALPPSFLCLHPLDFWVAWGNQSRPGSGVLYHRLNQPLLESGFQPWAHCQARIAGPPAARVCSSVLPTLPRDGAGALRPFLPLPSP